MAIARSKLACGKEVSRFSSNFPPHTSDINLGLVQRISSSHRDGCPAPETDDWWPAWHHPDSEWADPWPDPEATRTRRRQPTACDGRRNPSTEELTSLLPRVRVSDLSFLLVFGHHPTAIVHVLFLSHVVIFRVGLRWRFKHLEHVPRLALPFQRDILLEMFGVDWGHGERWYVQCSRHCAMKLTEDFGEHVAEERVDDGWISDLGCSFFFSGLSHNVLCCVFCLFVSVCHTDSRRGRLGN